MNLNALLLPAIIVWALILRLLPHILGFKDTGVDHWFWKAYIEKYRRDRIFPPDLPQYTLEKHQWYPPVFPLIIANIPRLIFDRYSYFMAIAVDLIRMTLLLGAVNWLTHGNLLATGTSGLIYATTPILVSYNIQLNPRGLGALLLDVIIILIIWSFLSGMANWIWALVLLISGLLLLTHKMTAQLFFFLCLMASVLFKDWRFLALIPGSILSALIISRGFYWKVFRAHWDIVSFWNRNWKWLQANQIKESPVYGFPGYETPTKYYKKGLKGFSSHIFYFLSYNPSLWLLTFALIFARNFNNHIPQFLYGLCVFLVLEALFALATVFIPAMRCLGSGYYYLYNAAFPVSLIWGAIMHSSQSASFMWAIFLTAVFLNLFSIGMFYRKIFLNKKNVKNAGINKAIDYLKQAKKGTVICLPPVFYDMVAYKTGQPVLFGGHGYGFKLLEQVFPVFLCPLGNIIEEYNVRYILAEKGYATDRFIKDAKPAKTLDFEQYQLYIIQND